MASSWLDRVVADNLGKALVWRNSKRNVKTEPGTEPRQHHQYTDNGSSLKVRVSMPSAVLQVLKVSLCVRRRFFRLLRSTSSSFHNIHMPSLGY